MKFFITGGNGFIARNLNAVLTSRGHEVDTGMSKNVGAALSRINSMHLDYDNREPCVHRTTPNAWARYFEKNKIDCVIHTAAIVGTDVVALNPEEATLTNVLGTRHIIQACEKAKIPVCYTGTTVVYDPAQSRIDQKQRLWINEGSEVFPHTYYGILKSAADQIVENSHVSSMIVRPLFAYGGIGDMNSLIAKTLFASHTGRDHLDMFLNPKNVKDYIHVTDFCEAVTIAIEKQLWNEDFIISAETPMKTSEVVDIIAKHCANTNKPENFLKWHSSTDYLGNHRLSSKKFREASGWSPRISLDDGIEQSAKDIIDYIVSSHMNAAEYDPMKHLDDAKKRNIDLTKFY